MLPMLLVLGTTIAGMVLGVMEAVGKQQWAVASVGAVIFLLAGWVLAEALLVVRRVRREQLCESREQGSS